MLLKFHLWLRELAFSRSLSLESVPLVPLLTSSSHLSHLYLIDVCVCVRLRLKCDETRLGTRFRVLAKRTSPFKSAGSSVQSTVGSRGLRISGSNAGYTMFRSSVKSTGYPLHSPVSPSLPFPSRALPCAITFQLDSTPVGQLSYLISSDAFVRLTTSSRSSHFHPSRSERKRISWSGRFLVKRFEDITPWMPIKGMEVNVHLTLRRCINPLRSGGCFMYLLI
jgi:hypothetical protein